MTDPKREVADILREKDNFIISGHFNPDGDAIGSTSAVGHILSALGKNFTIYNPSGLPPQFEWLDLPAELSAELPSSGNHWIVALDCGDLARLGGELGSIWDQRHTMNIDHHLGNDGFAEVNWVDTSYSSVGEMIAELARELGIPLTGGLGESIYLAMVSDTGNFSYGNTSPASFRLAAEIIEQGLELESFNHKYQNQWSYNRLQLWSAILGDAELFDDGRIGLIKITNEILARTGTTVYDTENLVNFVRKVKSVQVAVSLREENNGRTKFSLRSNGEVNVQKLASKFGGGGHKNASGGSIRAPIDKSAKTIVEAARRALQA